MDSKNAYIKEGDDIQHLNGQEITDRICTLPNLLTLVRLLLLPVFIYVFVTLGNNIWGFIILAFSCITDFFDGLIARKLGSISRIGMMVDPIVDRLVILTALICVCVVGRLPLWILILLVARDLILGVLNLVLKIKKLEFRVIFLGKLTTALLFIGFVMLVLNWPMVAGLGLTASLAFPGFNFLQTSLGIWFVYVGMVTSWITFFIYFAKAFKTLF